MAKYVTVSMSREMHALLVRMADRNGLSVPGQIVTYVERGLSGDAAGPVAVAAVQDLSDEVERSEAG
jgi:hypothetical protein